MGDLVLFPSKGPAPAPPAGSLDTWQQLPPKTTTAPIAPAAAPARQRRRVLLPARAHGRDRRNPDDEQAAAGARSRLKRDAEDAIRGTLTHLAGAAAPAGLEELEDTTPTRRRTSTGEWSSSTRGADRRAWLYAKAAGLAACQEVRAFREAQCGTYTPQPLSCRCRICPDCERARAGEAVRATQAILEDVAPRRRSFVVLTIRNLARLRAGLDQLDGAVLSLRRRPLYRGGRCRWRTRDGAPGHPCTHPTHRRDRNCPDFQHRPVAGGVRFTEVTYNAAAATWHPHANLLLDAPFLEQAELADTWRACTCSDPKHRRRGWCPRECDAGSSVVWIRQVDPGSVREAVKYVTKATDLLEGDDPVPVVEFLLATRNRRMAQGFGSFFGLELEELDELEEYVEVAVTTGEHDQAGRAIVLRYRLPRFCRACGRDTKLGDDSCTYEAPIVVPRTEVRLRNGAPTWRPGAPPRPPRPN